jgi:hypothetical protein
VGFLPRLNKVCSADDISLPRVERKGNVCAKRETQETFGLHRQIIRKFRRRKVIAPFIDYQWDADTAVMKSFIKDNDGYAYFVVAIDVFSRFAHTFPLRSTRGKEMSSALQTLFRRGKKPTKLRTDKGVEFRNRDVQRL